MISESVKAILEAIDIGRRVPSSDRHLIEGIDLQLHAGNRVAVVGASGSGKTLLLRAMALLDHAEEGEIRWHGESISDQRVPEYRVPEFRSKVVYLHQTPSLIEGTVEDNLKLPFSLKVHAAKKYDRECVIEQLQSLGRDESFLKKQQRDLSGGELQLTALLRAIQLDPKVLLLDEPTSALDAKATADVERLVTSWIDRNPQSRAMIWVTHDADQAKRIGETIYQMTAGKLKQVD